MSKIEDGGPAFPVVKDQYDYGYEKEMPKQVALGMTLRDYFAAKAMQGLLSAPYAENEDHMTVSISDGLGFRDGMRGRIAVAAYAMADAMLKARSQS